MITLPTRLDLIKILPPGALLAEVGTWRAYFATEILNNTPVGRLFCVDPWQGQTGNCSENEKTVAEHEADLSETKHHLRGHLPSGRVRVVRGFSVDVATNDRTIPPLDGVYVDADHTYQACFDDLTAWSKRLKPNGVLMGHDYTANEFSKKWNWGVIEAVRDFCAKYGWQITHLTDEDFASYRLERISEWRGAEN